MSALESFLKTGDLKNLLKQNRRLLKIIDFGDMIDNQQIPAGAWTICGTDISDNVIKDYCNNQNSQIEYFRLKDELHGFIYDTLELMGFGLFTETLDAIKTAFENPYDLKSVLISGKTLVVNLCCIIFKHTALLSWKCIKFFNQVVYNLYQSFVNPNQSTYSVSVVYRYGRAFVVVTVLFQLAINASTIFEKDHQEFSEAKTLPSGSTVSQQLYSNLFQSTISGLMDTVYTKNSLSSAFLNYGLLANVFYSNIGDKWARTGLENNLAQRALDDEVGQNQCTLDEELQTLDLLNKTDNLIKQNMDDLIPALRELPVKATLTILKGIQLKQISNTDIQLFSESLELPDFFYDAKSSDFVNLLSTLDTFQKTTIKPIVYRGTVTQTEDVPNTYLNPSINLPVKLLVSNYESLAETLHEAGLGQLSLFYKELGKLKEQRSLFDNKLRYNKEFLQLQNWTEKQFSKKSKCQLTPWNNGKALFVNPNLAASLHLNLDMTEINDYPNDTLLREVRGLLETDETFLENHEFSDLHLRAGESLQQFKTSIGLADDSWMKSSLEFGLSYVIPTLSNRQKYGAQLHREATTELFSTLKNNILGFVGIGGLLGGPVGISAVALNILSAGFKYTADTTVIMTKTNLPKTLRFIYDTTGKLTDRYINNEEAKIGFENDKKSMETWTQNYFGLSSDQIRNVIEEVAIQFVTASAEMDVVQLIVDPTTKEEKFRSVSRTWLDMFLNYLSRILFSVEWSDGLTQSYFSQIYNTPSNFWFTCNGLTSLLGGLTYIATKINALLLVERIAIYFLLSIYRRIYGKQNKLYYAVQRPLLIIWETNSEVYKLYCNYFQSFLFIAASMERMNSTYVKPLKKHRIIKRILRNLNPLKADLEMPQISNKTMTLNGFNNPFLTYEIRVNAEDLAMSDNYTNNTKPLDSLNNCMDFFFKYHYMAKELIDIYDLSLPDYTRSIVDYTSTKTPIGLTKRYLQQHIINFNHTSARSYSRFIGTVCPEGCSSMPQSLILTIPSPPGSNLLKSSYDGFIDSKTDSFRLAIVLDIQRNVYELIDNIWWIYKIGKIPEVYQKATTDKSDNPFRLQNLESNTFSFCIYKKQEVIPKTTVKRDEMFKQRLNLLFENMIYENGNVFQYPVTERLKHNWRHPRCEFATFAILSSKDASTEKFIELIAGYKKQVLSDPDFLDTYRLSCQILNIENEERTDNEKLKIVSDFDPLIIFKLLAKKNNTNATFYFEDTEKINFNTSGARSNFQIGVLTPTLAFPFPHFIPNLDSPNDTYEKVAEYLSGGTNPTSISNYAKNILTWGNTLWHGLRGRLSRQ